VPSSGEPNEAGGPTGKIVVGIDGSDASVAALRWALEEARLRGLKIVAVHAHTLPHVSTTSQALHLIETGLDAYRAAGAEILERALADAEAADDVDVERRVIEGPPASALLDAAEDAELLVVGSRGHGGFAALLLGSVSEQCAHHSPCPVVIVRSATRP
jgi:nucleotide-binding universal stress UspA family protein